MNRRVNELKRIEKMIEQIKTWITFQNFPTDEIIERLAEAHDFSSFLFLGRCSDLMKKNYVFPEAWKKAITDKRNSLSLKNEELRFLIAFSEIIGTASVQRQLESLDGLKEEIDRVIIDAEKEKQKKGKLYRSLGLFGGAAVAIIII